MEISVHWRKLAYTKSSHVSRTPSKSVQGRVQDYQKGEPAISWRIAKHVINGIACLACVCSRDQKNEIGSQAESGAEGFRVPVESLYLLGQPEVKVHGIEHGAKSLAERLAPHKTLWSWRHDCSAWSRWLNFLRMRAAANFRLLLSWASRCHEDGPEMPRAADC